MRLQVNNEFLDLFSSEVIAQTYSVNEIGNITNRQGGFSNDFNIPLTAKNKRILGFPNDINTSSNAAYEKVDATLFDRGTVVGTGYLKYERVENSKTIKISFFSDNVEWFILIKDKTLKDLDLIDQDHLWDGETITDAISANKSSGYTYPLIDYGEFGALTSLAVDSDQMFPAVFISTIVEQIFYDIGWKVEGEMIDHPLYKRMIIPFSDESFSHSREFIDNNTTNIDLPQLQQGSVPASTTDVIPIVWYLPSTETVTIDEPGIYNVRVFGNLLIGANLQEALFILNNNGSLVTQEEVFNGYSVMDVDVFLDAGTIDIDLSIQATGTGNCIWSILVADTSIAVTPQEAISAGSTIQVANILPDIKQSDLMKYLAFIFGSVPQSNNLSKTVNFGLFRSIQDNISDALDWSNKIDLSRRSSIDFTELLDTYSSTSILTYLEDSNDSELTTYQADTSKVFGQGQIEITNEHVSGLNTIYEAPFSGMINIMSFNGTISAPQISYKVIGGNDLKPVPKIAILSENIAVSDYSLGLYTELSVTDSVDGVTVYTETDIPFCWFAKTETFPLVDVMLDNLSFDPILSPNVIGDSLIDRFLGNYEDILNEMKYLKVYAHLTEIDINSLDFLIPIYIDRYKAYFYISKINNYQGSQKTTEIELVKIP